MRYVFLLCGFCLLLEPLALRQAVAKDEVSIEGLRNKEYRASLQQEAKLYEREGYDGSLMSYKSDGLKIYALVNRPNSSKPKQGFPIVVFGHGFHPEPKKYGITAEGKVSRPGDYYRGIPEHFALQGFVVVTSDYRGHNVSGGFEFTKTSYLASSYYASDVLHLVAALPSLNDVDLSRIYYLGHSMGGDVGLKVLLASDKFKAASLWSPVVSTTAEQALFYGKYYDETISPKDAQVDQKAWKHYTRKIDAVYESLGIEVTQEQVDPIGYVDELATPLIIHHARGDGSVPYAWSESLVAKLLNLDKPVAFHAYASDNHLFKGENLANVFQRDVQFFNRYK